MERVSRELPSPVNDAIISLLNTHINDMNPQGFANTIYGLGLMGIEWNRIPQLLQRKICENLLKVVPRMTSQGTTNTFYGLGAMKAKFSDFPLSFRSLVIKMVQEQFHETEFVGIAALFHGLASMGFEWNDFGEESIGITEDKLQSLVEQSTPWNVAVILYS